ncbi:hypothetical protein EC973_005857 [Apophysomyces ossiformis]|uniref:Uncharacterized protein n=1 Tax=Apophysomyces ossiformis TaxID=679940 RepID=A0A8H7BRW1_9FUNG|nr:hypothetical protein EC973_005857 [Apophysomyces ossiformis]
MLSEHHHLRHDILEFQYLAFRQQKDLGDVTLPAFSTFDDPLGYAGFAPGAKYLTKVYNDFVEEKVVHYFQHTSSLPANIVHNDHSHKVNKHLCKLGGVKIFEGLFTMTNEMGEIRIQHFVPSTSMDYVKKSLDDVKLSLISFEHSMPKVLFTDKVDHDKKFFEMQFESLKEDIQAVRSTDPHKYLPILTLPESVTYTVHSTETQINDALTPLLEQLDDPAYNTTVGFDAEWTFNADTRSMWKPVAVVQVAYPSFGVRILKLSKLKSIPHTLLQLIACGRIRKTGRSISQDRIFDGRTVTKSRLVIDIERILVPGAMLQLTEGKHLSAFGQIPFRMICRLQCFRYRRHSIEQLPEQEDIPEISTAPSVAASYRDDITIEPDTNLPYALDYDIDDTPSEEAEEDESESEPESEEFVAQELDASVIDVDSQRLGRSLLDPIYTKAREQLRDTEANSIHTRMLQDAWHALKCISVPT